MTDHTRYLIEDCIIRGDYEFLRGLNLKKADLSMLDFSNADMRDLAMIETNFRGCKFVRSNLQAVKMVRVILAEADLSFANFTDAFMHSVRFSPFISYHPELRNNGYKQTKCFRSQFINTNLSYSWFSGSDLRFANFFGADLNEVIMNGTDLRGADLRVKNIIFATFNDSIYNIETIWPEGFNPVDAGAIFVAE
ncbi:MAG: pentapeptide repeat-containing protein [Roseiflexaceae bacterium]